jgi:hypothetical protein
MRKGKNIGFIKVDVRNDGRCRLEVHINSVFTVGREKCEIFSIQKMDRKAKGYYVGEFPVVDKRGEWRLQCAENQFDDHGNVIDSIEGFAFRMSDGRTYLALFNGNNPEFDILYVGQEPILIREGFTVPEKEETTEEELSEDFVNIKDENSELEDKNLEGFLLNSSQIVNEETIDKRQKNPDNVDQEKGKKNFNTWEEIESNCPQVTPFENSEGIQYFKIGEPQLSVLTEEYGMINHNSFLLHGLNSYNYIVIGRKKDDVCILGVPGIYHDREQMMASMFGFPHFKNAKNEKVTMGIFGYYIKDVKVRISQFHEEIQPAYN